MYVLRFYRLEKDDDKLNHIKNSIENFISKNILQSRQNMYINYRTNINIKFDEKNNHLLIYFTLALYNNGIIKINRNNSNREKVEKYIKDIFKKFDYEYISSKIISSDAHIDNIYIFVKKYSFNEFVNKFLGINNIINIFKNRVFDINSIYLINDFTLEREYNDIITYIKFDKYFRSYNFDKSNIYGIKLILNEFLPYKYNMMFGKYNFEFIYDLNKNGEISIKVKYKDRKNFIELSIISEKDEKHINKYVDYMKIIYNDKDYFYTTKDNLTGINENFIHNVRKEIEMYIFNNLIDFIQGNKKMKYLITRKHTIKDVINAIKVCDILI